LDDVVEPLVEFLGRSLGHQNVAIVARTHRAGGNPASATVHLRPEGQTEPFEEWRVREAWWARNFKPSNSGTVLGWAVRAFGSHLVATAQNVFWRNVRRVFGHPPLQQGAGVWKIPTPIWPYALLDAVAW